MRKGFSWRRTAVAAIRLRMRSSRAGRRGGGVSGGVSDLDSFGPFLVPFWSFFVLFGPFLSFLVLFGPFLISQAFPDCFGDFPIGPFPPSRPTQNTYQQHSRKGLRHNQDLSRKKVGKPPVWNPPGLSSLKTSDTTQIPATKSQTKTCELGAVKLTSDGERFCKGNGETLVVVAEIPCKWTVATKFTSAFGVCVCSGRRS